MIDLARINHVGDFSLREAYALSDNLVPLIPTSTDLLINVKNEKIAKLEKEIIVITSALEQYNPTLLQLIYDIFTLKILKVYLLKKSLSLIADKIKHVVKKSYKRKAAYVKRSIDHIKKRSPLRQFDLLRLEFLTKAISQLQSNKDVPGLEFLTENNDVTVKHKVPNTINPILLKTDLVGRALDYMDKSGIFSDLDKSVHFYLTRTLNELKANQNVPLPRWYYSYFKAEKTSDILKSRKIHTQHTIGMGDFIFPCASSKDEYKTMGNAFTVAFDHHNTWKDRSVQYIVKKKDTGSNELHDTIWAYSRRAINLDANNVAFVVSSNPAVINELVEKDIPVVPRNFSERLREIFERVEPVKKKLRQSSS